MEIQLQDQKGTFSDKELNTLEVAILSFLALLQADCHKEKKRDNIISVGRKLKDAVSFGTDSREG
jgi:hypothetical protein